MLIKFYLWACIKMVLMGNRGLGSSLDNHGDWCGCYWGAASSHPSPPCQGKMEQMDPARMGLGANRELRNYWQGTEKWLTRKLSSRLPLQPWQSHTGTSAGNGAKATVPKGLQNVVCHMCWPSRVEPSLRVEYQEWHHPRTWSTPHTSKGSTGPHRTT